MAKAGIVNDDNGKYIGKYIWIQQGDQELLDRFCDSWLKTYKEDSRFKVCIDLETQGLDYITQDILLFSISWNGKDSIIFDPMYFELTKLKEVLATIPVVNTNIKFDAKWIYYKYGIEIQVAFDAMVGAQLGWAGAFPGFGKKYSLDNLVDKLLKLKISKDVRQEFIGKVSGSEYTIEQIEYAVKDSLLTYRLVHPITKRLQNENLWHIWENVEVPLIQSMIRSEVKGVLIDVEKLKELYALREKELKETYDEILVELAKIPKEKLPKFTKDKFNPKSPKQLVDLMAVVGIKLKSTEAEVLDEAMATHNLPLLTKIIKYRHIQDEISKYLKSFLEKYINPVTNCVHPNYQTCGADATGRLASSHPNTQNLAPDFRPMIVARPNHSLICSDASAFEFRSAAALSGEEYLLDAFRERAELLPEVKEVAAKYGETDPDTLVKSVEKKILTVTQGEHELINRFANTDIHRRNGALIFGCEPNEITSDQRSVSKCVDLNSIVFTDKGLFKVRDFLPAKPKEKTYYELKDVKVQTDTGFKIANKIYYAGILPSLVITTKSGRKIICSEEHKFRVWKNNKYQWIKSKSLKEQEDLILKMGDGFYAKSSKKIIEAQEFGNLLKNSKVVDNKVFVPEDCQFTVYKVGRADKKSGLVEVEIDSLELNNIPEWILNGTKEVKIGFLNNFINNDFYLGWSFSGNESVLGQVQLLLQTEGINSFLKTNKTHLVDGIPKLVVWNGNRTKLLILLGKEKKKKVEVLNPKADQIIMPSSMVNKIINEGTLNDTELKFLDFMKTNNLIRDQIVSIEKGPKIPMGDFSVPENNTVVYNGYVSHNTLGYSALYSSGPGTIQVQLAKQGNFYSLDQCKSFQAKFFNNLPKIKKLTDEIKENMLKDGYVTSMYGRKRFFVFPPKYQTRLYEQTKQKFYREAVNAPFQMSNADATKITMVKLEDYYRSFVDYLMPTTLLNIHDEIVVEAHDDICAEVAPIVHKVFVESCSEALQGKAPVECSYAIMKRWSK